MLSAFRGKSQAEAARCSSADLSNPRSALACRTRRDRTSGATSILHHFPYTNLTVPRLVSAAQKLRTLSPTDWVRSEARHQFVRRVRRALFATLPCDQGQCSFEQLIRQAHVSQAALNCSPNRWVCSIPPQLSSLGARCALIQNTCEVGATFTAARLGHIVIKDIHGNNDEQEARDITEHKKPEQKLA
jgi:hypothetical protein